jgi:hypothetical protein
VSTLAIFEGSWTSTWIEHQNKSAAVRVCSSFFKLHLMEKLHYLLMLHSLDIPWKPCVPGKSARLYNPSYHCSQHCCHPRRVPVVVKPESISCRLMLEIRVPQVHLLWPTTAKDSKRNARQRLSLWLAATTAVAAGPTSPPREQEARVLRPRLVISRKQHDSRSSVWRSHPH